jgi:hypothetical protein
MGIVHVYAAEKPVVRKNVVMLPFLPICIHGANHKELDMSPLVGALEFGAAVHSVAQATVEVAAGCLDPRPMCGRPPL